MNIRLKSVDWLDWHGTEFEEFYKSLGLNINLQHKEQTFDLTQLEYFTVFNMHLDVRQDESFQVNEWECSFTKEVCSFTLENRITIFWINKCAVAALISDPTAIKDLPTSLRLLVIEQVSLLEEDLSGIPDLEKLKVLGLKCCKIRTNLRELSRSKNLEHLALSHCEQSVSFLDVSHLQQITNLDVFDCDSFSGLSGLDQNHRLKALQISRCDSVKSVQWLSGLGRLEFLGLHGCRSIASLQGLEGLDSLEVLDLSQCDALTDLSSLPELKNLKKLNLRWCDALTDLSGVRKLVQLTELNLERCMSLINIDDLAELPELKVLQLSWSKFLFNPSIYAGSLARLSQLTVLEMDGCREIQALAGLGKLVRLEYLSLAESEIVDETNLERLIGGLKKLKGLSLRQTRIENLNVLSSLNQLNALNLSKCTSLNNLDGLSNLNNLERLDLAGPNKVTDFSALKEKENLKYLDLSGCSIGLGHFLSDLVGLEHLKLGSSGVVILMKDVFCSLQNLKILHLNRCGRLRHLNGLSELKSLTELDLSDCAFVSDLSSICGLPNLKKLDILNLCRLRSLEPLRDLPQLCELNSTFHPGVVSEVLAHSAVLRSDKADIHFKCEDWLNELEHFTDEERSQQERFAATLGEAFSMLGEHDIVSRYESFLDSHPEFSATPWKAWLQGSAKHQGHEFLVMRVERVVTALLSPGAVGGICASLPSETAPLLHQNWARKWLKDMESAWQTRAKELLPVSAEVCLAHARLGLQQALECWLDRFTDSSDPAAFDPVQAALGQWQLDQNNTNAALHHAMAIHQPQVRDPLLGRIVGRCHSNEADLAGRALLMITDETLAGRLSARLAQDGAFVASASNVERLMVACGNSMQALAVLIENISTNADPTHLQSLSFRLQSSPEAVRKLRRTLLLRLAEEA
jgi:Leucine-rich repeat (LRR) protein